MLQYTWAYIVFGKSCLSSCRTLWVCFSSGFFVGVFFPLYSASLQAGFSAFEMSPLFTLRSSWIKYNNCWKLNEPADLEKKTKKTSQTNNKKQQPQDNSLNIFTEQIFTGQLFSLTITSMRILCFIMFLLSFQKRNLPYGKWSGFLGDHKTALLSLRRACCICGACDCLWSPGPPECAFSIKDQKRFFLSSLCCLCMYSFSIRVRNSHTLQRNLTSEIISEVPFGFDVSSCLVHGLYNQVSSHSGFLKKKRIIIIQTFIFENFGTFRPLSEIRMGGAFSNIIWQ